MFSNLKLFKKIDRGIDISKDVLNVGVNKNLEI